MRPWLIGAGLGFLLWVILPFRLVEPDPYADEWVRCKEWAYSDSIELRVVLEGIQEIYHLSRECSVVSHVGNPRMWKPFVANVDFPTDSAVRWGARQSQPLRTDAP